MTSEMRLFILDLHNAIADFDNDRLSGNGLRNEIAERNKEIAEMFNRIMSNPAQFETVGEPMPHNIKF